jgi:glyoxylase I family protein
MTISGIEHIGFVINNPWAAADWYQLNLSYTILRKAGDNSVAFIQEPVTGLILELIGSGDIRPIDKDLSHPLQVHIAIKSDDLDKDKKKLMAAGASFVMDCRTDDPDARVCVLKDPFGLYLQIAQRRRDFYA